MKKRIIILASVALCGLSFFFSCARPAECVECERYHFYDAFGNYYPYSTARFCRERGETKYQFQLRKQNAADNGYFCVPAE